MSSFLQITVAALFSAGVLFLVAAGLQLVFGVQRVVNLASGSLYALGAYFGASTANWFLAQGGHPLLLIPILILSALVIGSIGFLLERIVRSVYRRDEAFQLLLTFAIVLMFQDVFRYVWGAQPQLLLAFPGYGRLEVGGATLQVYNLLIIAISVLIAAGLAFVLERTRTGHIVRATAENRAMAEGLGVNGATVNTAVFTLGSMLGAIGGALVIPTTAASLEMPIELIVEAFAIIVIGGLGSIRGAFVGALIVGLMRALAITFYAELEVIAIYLVMVAVLLFRPQGLFGKPAA